MNEKITVWTIIAIVTLMSPLYAQDLVEYALKSGTMNVTGSNGLGSYAMLSQGTEPGADFDGVISNNDGSTIFTDVIGEPIVENNQPIWVLKVDPGTGEVSGIADLNGPVYDNNQPIWVLTAETGNGTELDISEPVLDNNQPIWVLHVDPTQVDMEVATQKAAFISALANEGLIETDYVEVAMELLLADLENGSDPTILIDGIAESVVMVPEKDASVAEIWEDLGTGAYYDENGNLWWYSAIAEVSDDGGVNMIPQDPFDPCPYFQQHQLPDDSVISIAISDENPCEHCLSSLFSSSSMSQYIIDYWWLASQANYQNLISLGHGAELCVTIPNDYTRIYVQFETNCTFSTQKTFWYYKDIDLDPCLISEPRLANETTIEIYPNPVSNILSLQMSNESSSSIKLYDMNGQLVFEEINLPEINSMQIDVSNYNSGIYILVVNNGSESEAIKVQIK